MGEDLKAYFSRLDKILLDIKELRNPKPAEPEPRTGPCGINYWSCPPQYPPGYELKKGEDKCSACLMNPIYDKI